MSYSDAAHYLDKVFAEATEDHQPALPKGLQLKFGNWKWGGYGWTSPTNLILTAAWHKVIFPDIDCCKIWSRDESGKTIPGAYSIRSADESVTVPFVNKHDLTKGFCSPNSGMQGARAIEKGRAQGRVGRHFGDSQRTVYDLVLLAGILNDIEEGGPEVAHEVVKTMLSVALQIRKKRIDEQEGILALRYQDQKGKLTALPDLFNDPEMFRALVAGVLMAAVDKFAAGWSVEGTDDPMTAADARSGKAGDLWIADESGAVIVGFEIKDPSRSIDWTILRAGSRFLTQTPSMRGFFIIGGSKAPIHADVLSELKNVAALFRFDPLQRQVSTLSIYDVLLMADALGLTGEVLGYVGTLITSMKSIKEDTRAIWFNLFSGK